MSEDRRLDIALLDRAVARLQGAVNDWEQNPRIEAYRDSVVIRFLFTYELAVQLIRRYVELEHRKPLPPDEATTSRIVRRANSIGILRAEWDEFSRFRDARNGIAHTYDEARAIEVAALAEQFVGEARYLLAQLRERLNG